MTDENKEIQAQLDELKRSNEALEAKNQELLSETKAEREKRRTAEEARAASDEAARAKEAEAAERSGDIEAIKRAAEEKYAKSAAEETARADGLEAQLSKLVIDGGIRDAMSKAEIAPALMRGASFEFKDGRDIKIIDGEASVDGVPLTEAVTEWASSEDGAAYRAAGQANGSGAPGGGKSTGKALAEMGDEERLALARQGKLNPA